MVGAGLDPAHRRLGEAVFAAYGWQSDLSDEEILEKLPARSKAGAVSSAQRVLSEPTSLTT
jgi:hypothetical protein